MQHKNQLQKIYARIALESMRVNPGATQMILHIQAGNVNFQC
jgi:hypothetical protein